MNRVAPKARKAVQNKKQEAVRRFEESREKQFQFRFRARRSLDLKFLDEKAQG